MPKISVIIPVYNALADVKLCLESILKNFNFRMGDVTVINDCSDNNTTNYLRKFFESYPHIKIIENQENLGFLKTCNIGMQSVKGDIIVLLNSDTIIPSEFCERIIKCFKSNNKIGIASPIGSYTNKYCISLPKNYTIEKMNKLLRKRHQCCYPLLPRAEGFCYAIKREVIDSQGYFDDIYGKGYYEETDYSLRAITNGWINVLIDDLYVYHKRQASFGAENKKKLTNEHAPIFKARWGNFIKEYTNKHKLVNPVIKIEQEMFPDRKPDSCKRSFMEFLFSIKNSNNKNYKIITLFNIAIKLKRENVSFSVIMPTYNRAFCISNAINSLLSQNYKNFELIIVDDGSTDNTQELIHEKYKKYIQNKKIKYIKIKKCGVSRARNEGLKQAQFQWIAYLDTDNIMMPDYLSEFSNAIKNNPKYKCFYAKLITTKGEVKGKIFDFDALCNKNYIDMGVFVHRKLLVKKYGGFDTNIKRTVDWDLIIRYTNHCKPFFINKILLQYSDNNHARITNTEDKNFARSIINKKINNIQRHKKIINNIFSVKNDNKHKIVTVLGIKIKLKNTKRLINKT